MRVSDKLSVLPRDVLERLAVEVAPLVLGCVVVHDSPEGRVAVRLTEVEAYAGEGEDPGSHAHRGETARNTVMFGPPGHLYVYFTYGMHWCANVVCLPRGRASAILLRGGEVIEGEQLARARRAAAKSSVELARGPARLAQALGLIGAANGLDLCDGRGPVFLYAGEAVDRSFVRTGPRTGVGGDGAARPWRFWLDGERTVSPYRAHMPKQRASRASAAGAG
jgi:DNA-3-methyladenine glycosylase